MEVELSDFPGSPQRLRGVSCHPLHPHFLHLVFCIYDLQFTFYVFRWYNEWGTFVLCALFRIRIFRIFRIFIFQPTWPLLGVMQMLFRWMHTWYTGYYSNCLIHVSVMYWHREAGKSTSSLLLCIVYYYRRGWWWLASVAEPRVI